MSQVNDGDQRAARFMRRAIELACDNVRAGGRPYGAVIVRAGVVVSEGVNEMHLGPDPSAHAELLALRAASASLGRARLEDCVVYASGQPCPMCLAAIHLAGVQQVYFAYSNEDGAPYGFSTAAISERLALPLSAQGVEQVDASCWPDNPFALAADASGR